MNPNNNLSQSAYVAQDESRMMTRAEAAAVRRTFADTEKSLIAIQRNLLSISVTEDNIATVSQQLMAASQLRESLKHCKNQLLQSLPNNTGGKLSDQERKEIAGFYHTGNYTQEVLAEQYQVSQGTIHNVIAKSELSPSEPKV
jgi:DNA-binding transcriptional regulator LsrR (DeoR family)